MHDDLLFRPALSSRAWSAWRSGAVGRPCSAEIAVRLAAAVHRPLLAGMTVMFARSPGVRERIFHASSCVHKRNINIRGPTAEAPVRVQFSALLFVAPAETEVRVQCGVETGADS